jgi:hypothetical protein
MSPSARVSTVERHAAFLSIGRTATLEKLYRSSPGRGSRITARGVEHHTALPDYLTSRCRLSSREKGQEWLNEAGGI